MTIGIAAFGPGAGRAIVAGLAAAEKIGHGAIGGFVSLAAIGRDGRLHRAETQDGGTATLFGAGPMPAAVAEAHHAVLMSSGPNRPEPLAQFTPADPAVGLITGHRFPNMSGASGLPLNEEVLARLAAGASPEAAIEAVVGANGRADAGLIALTLDGRLAARNTEATDELVDAGAAELADPRLPSHRVAVLHNAIRPWRGLALLVAESVLDAFERPDADLRRIVIRAGTPISPGARSRIEVDDAGVAIALVSALTPSTRAKRDLGLGPEAEVHAGGTLIGIARSEPYMVVENERLLSVNGLPELTLEVGPP
jgi:hypothetical protein